MRPLEDLTTPVRAWLHRFAFLLLVGGAFALMLVGKADGILVERARTTVVDAVAPILDAASRPVATVADVLREGRELAVLRAQNAALRKENARLKHWQLVARRLEAENAALAQLLDMAPEPQTDYVTGRVIADSGGAFVRSVLINAGTNHGIAKGQAALTGEGLAGRVAEVGRTSGRVLLITDINSRIPVVIESTRQRGILAGDNSDRPKLVYLPEEAEVAVGQRIVTSGHGGVFPPGLPVGEIVKAGEHGVRVRPFADWNRMEYLRVVDYGMPGILMTREDDYSARIAAATGAPR
ncbi:rod shape-determining protein MreC [Ferruginivarius sediminum]|uniref:Cell shape-determining protein MreC n=2 Tax=Ferruginivarius sediminum TaxID=2661937 RepID=A0A369TEB5_9PROT|nr:rod shape-determining protein MreC [Ferruginivarius sediminum]